MRSSVLSVVGCSALVAACAAPSSPGRDAPADRPLFRLEVEGLADGASAADAAPAATPPAGPWSLPAPAGKTVRAYTTSVRFVTPDGKLLVAPRVTAYAGQNANIQIVNQTAYVRDFDLTREGDGWIADPVIAMLHTGTLLEFVVEPAAGGADAVLAMRFRNVTARKPVGERVITIPGIPGAAPVTVQTPRTEEVELTGAQRVRLGEESEWARVPDPDGGADLRLFGRVDAVDPSEFEDAPPAESFSPAGDSARTERGAGAPDDAAASDALRSDPATLRRLAAAAQGATLGGVLSVTAMRLPAGIDDPLSVSAERLGGLALRTVAGAGARASDRLREAYFRDFEFAIGGAGRRRPPDPVLDLAVSGLEMFIDAPGALRVRWTTVPGFDTFETTFGEGLTWTSFAPTTHTSERTVALTPGLRVHPMFRLADGGTAAIVVEYTPDQAR